MQSNEPLVSVCCAVYKHEKYIRDCLEGFVMQKTNFPFEVLINDDASPDRTADIIREYEAKYPDIIKPIYQSENQYSKGKRITLEYLFPRAKGKYIALCEGDDFWCDPYKLQVQFDFMEQNPEYSLCMHGRYILNHFTQKFAEEPFIQKFPENGVEFAHCTALGKNMFSTQTMFFRRSSFEQKRGDILRDCMGAPMGDLQIVFHLALAGNVKYISRRMAVYRIAYGSATHTSLKKRIKFIKKANFFIDKMLKNSPYPEWAAERTERRKISFLYRLFMIPVLLFEELLNKFCLSSTQIAAKGNYRAYMQSHQDYFSENR